jgi:hypothetical protein
MQSKFAEEGYEKLSTVQRYDSTRNAASEILLLMDGEGTLLTTCGTIMRLDNLMLRFVVFICPFRCHNTIFHSRWREFSKR